MMANVLLVDDDPAVLACASAALTRFGYAVTRAGNAAEALRHFSQQTPDLLITDYRMPGMNGAELIQTIRTRQPELPIILITGLVDELPAWLRVGPRAVHILTKPFLIEELRSEVEDAIPARTAVPV